MQFHVPFGYVSPHAPVPAAVPPPPASASPSSSAHLDGAQSSSSGTGCGASTGYAVGQGLLSGRRLAVRLAPQSAAEPPVPVESSRVLGDRHVNMTPPGPSSSSSQVAHGLDRADVQMHAQVAVSTQLPQQQPPSSNRYGGGIVRISDLQKRGVAAVESGLRLATLQGGRPAATISANGTSAPDHDRPLADVFAPAASGGSASRRAPRGSSSAASSSTRTARGRGRGGRRSAGRGGRSSRVSVELELTESGELYDYRWFMARGRRCLMYNGQTYKGSAAHQMWTKMKQVGTKREQAARRQPAARATPAPSTRRTAAAAVSLRGRAHHTSTRALSAAQRSLELENVGARDRRAAAATLLTVTGGSGAPMSDEWRRLMEELGVDHYEELHHAVLAQCRASPSREQHQVQRAGDVVEITDSSDASSSFSSSPSSTDDSSSSSETDIDAEEALPPQEPQTLQWPNTAYFSDASSGWSSASSPAEATAASPPSRKAEKKEAYTSASAQPSPLPSPPPRLASAARVRVLDGVEVVEEDGWVYPKEVYAARQRQDRIAVAGAAVTTTPPISSSVTTHVNESGCIDSHGALQPRPALLLDTEDMPLSDLFTQAAAPQPTTTPQSSASLRTVLVQPSTVAHPPLPPAPLAGLRRPAAGLAVILGGREDALSLRPAASLQGRQGHGDVTAPKTSSSAAVLREVDDGDDVLEGFDAVDVADMFLIGEEIGGMRYGA